MSEGYNYQIVTGIVKVVRPSNRQILGIADGQGNFLWLPEAEIITSHPAQYDNWQTTMFAVNSGWKISWKPEKKWDEYKDSYPRNTKPIPQPVPQMFLTPSQAPIVPKQPIQPAPVQISQTAPQIPFQQTKRQINTVPNTYDLGLNDFLFRIANELEAIRKLLELYIKPPQFDTADTLTERDVLEEYGMPPYEEEVKKEVLPKVNKDDLPDIF